MTKGIHAEAVFNFSANDATSNNLCVVRTAFFLANRLSACTVTELDSRSIASPYAKVIAEPRAQDTPQTQPPLVNCYILCRPRVSIASYPFSLYGAWLRQSRTMYMQNLARTIDEMEIKSLLVRERYYRDTCQWEKLRRCYHSDPSKTLIDISWYVQSFAKLYHPKNCSENSICKKVYRRHLRLRVRLQSHV